MATHYSCDVCFGAVKDKLSLVHFQSDSKFFDQKRSSQANEYLELEENLYGPSPIMEIMGMKRGPKVTKQFEVCEDCFACILMMVQRYKKKAHQDFKTFEKNKFTQGD